MEEPEADTIVAEVEDIEAEEIGADAELIERQESSFQNDSDISCDPNTEQQLVDRHKPDWIKPSHDLDSETEPEFSCSVCLQLSVLPTTLTCGHTSCRHCLAQWYFTSKKKECPLCKAPYQGHPKVNTQLRNMLKRLYPSESESRDAEAEDPGVKDVISKYDKELSEEKQSSKSEITSFCSGIIVASCIFVVSYLAWYWKSHDDNLLVRKPVVYWRVEDVAVWLSEIVWAEQYSSLASENHIDGRILLSVTEEDLTRLLNITEAHHARALRLLIDHLQDTGLKMPANLWEYKALYPGRCLFLVFGLKDFPRTTILYLWLYFKEEMFNPFVLATQGSEDAQSVVYNLDKANGTNNTSFQPDHRALAGFVYYTVFLPEYLVGLIAVRMFKHHVWTPVFVLLTLGLRMTMEILKVTKMVRTRSWRMLLRMCKAHMKYLMSAFMFMVLWPIIPSLVCDVFFYCALYVSPIQLAGAIYQKVRHR